MSNQQSTQPMPTWYLLFDGESADGRGKGQYIGRTTDKEKARKHYLKCKKNFYSTGCVEILTDTKHVQAWQNTDWDSL